MWKEAVTACICFRRLHEAKHIWNTPVGLWGRIWTRDLPDMMQECCPLKCDIQCCGKFVKMYWFAMVTAIDTKTKKYCESCVCCQWSSCEAIHYSTHISLVLQFVPHWTQTKLRYSLKNISVIRRSASMIFTFNTTCSSQAQGGSLAEILNSKLWHHLATLATSAAFFIKFQTAIIFWANFPNS